MRRWRACPWWSIKKDGSRQTFDKSKLLNGMLRACEKRPVPFSQLEGIANEIEQALQNEMDREVPSARIGELVMDRLREVDEVAYVPLRLGLPPVQGHQHLHVGAEQAFGGEVSSGRRNTGPWNRIQGVRRGSGLPVLRSGGLAWAALLGVQ